MFDRHRNSGWLAREVAASAWFDWGLAAILDPSDGALMSSMDRPQKITFGEMREMGVRRILVYCSDHKCSHCGQRRSMGRSSSPV